MSDFLNCNRSISLRAWRPPFRYFLDQIEFKEPPSQMTLCMESWVQVRGISIEFETICICSTHGAFLRHCAYNNPWRAVCLSQIIPSKLKKIRLEYIHWLMPTITTTATDAYFRDEIERAPEIAQQTHTYFREHCTTICPNKCYKNKVELYWVLLFLSCFLR